jgi:hypothetical protein
LALSKAQTGQIGALTRLGIPLNAAAVKSKDLEGIQADLALRFAGAADAAANSADGGMKKLQIALDNTYEAVGYRLLPILSDYVTVIGDLSAKALDAEKSNGKFEKVLGLVVNHVFHLDAFKIANKLVGNYAKEIRGATAATDDFERIFRLQNMNMSKATVTVRDNEKAQRSATDAKKKARQAAKEYADTLRARVQTAVDATTDAVERAQAAYDDYSASLSSTIQGSVSLASAFQTQKDSEKELADSLKERAEAYASLGKINPVEDADAYADALERVAQAEADVTSAQGKRATSSYLDVFKKQISDAQAFARNLTELVNGGLSQAGLSQLMSLGPIAGKEVTDHLIAVPGAAAVTELNQQLAGLAGSAGAFGMAGANAFFGGNLSAANTAAGQVNQYSITVTAGLVSNPAQVGRDIIEAIKSAERVSGQVFVSV